jgi:glycerol-3-phosphate acyltransferase PlsX
MDESPVVACRKKPNSSIMVGLKYLKDGHASGFISAGNSGAVMTAGCMVLGRILGVSRPAIASLIPTRRGRAVILDVGANADCRAQHLLQFARLGSAYAQIVFGKKNPKVGLLNIGAEKGKGNELTVNVYKLLEKSNLNFYGNIEGFDINRGLVDVIVCDGFVGNIVIKILEGMSNWIKTEILADNLESKNKKDVQAWFANINEKINYEKYGGVPLLGLNGVCMISHGSSSDRAIAHAIRAASEAVRSNLVAKITDAFTNLN